MSDRRSSGRGVFIDIAGISLVGFFARCHGLLTNPSATFLNIREAGVRSAVLPLLAQVLTAAILVAVYYQWVNFDWLLTQLANTMPAEQGEALADIVSPGILAGSGVLASVVLLPLLTAAWALYFLLVGAIYNRPESYGQWFAMVSWSSIPAVLILPLGLLAMALSDGRLMTDQLNPLALNLLLGLPHDSPWRTLASSVTALLLLAYALSVVALRSWTGFSALRCAAIAATPYAVVYLTWAGIIIASAQW